jgi:hypothetical protein
VTFDSLYFDLIVTTMALHFQTLRAKEDPVAEDDPIEIPSEIIVKLLWMLKSRRSRTRIWPRPKVKMLQRPSLVRPLMMLNWIRERRCDFSYVGVYAM